MFYGAGPNLFKKALYLRHNLTETERLLWNRLNRTQLGVRFKSQHPVDIYIVDFYCHAAKLIVEIDGGYHLKKEARENDIAREAELLELGLRVIRFTNDQILDNIDKVIKKIIESIN